MAWDGTSQQPYPVQAAQPSVQSLQCLCVPLSPCPFTQQCSGLTHCLFLQLAVLSITQVRPPPTHEEAHRHSHVHPNPVGTTPSLPLGPEQPPDQPQHILEQSHVKPHTPFLSVCVLSPMCHTKEEKTTSL